MAFQVSPGVQVREIDLTNVVPAVSTSIGGFAGAFNWGPAEEITLVGSEKDLSRIFSTPDATTSKYFLVASSFLQYANALKVARVVASDALNASNGTPALIKNQDAYEGATLSGLGTWAARYPGELGNAITVAVYAAGTGTYATDFADYLASFDSEPGTSDYASERGCSNDEMHIAVIDSTGAITGTAGTVLETYAYVSQASDAKNSNGTTNYYKDVVNAASNYVFWAGHEGSLVNAGASTEAAITAVAGDYSDGTSLVADVDLAGGDNGAEIGLSELQVGFDLFEDSETVDVNLIFSPTLSGADNVTLSNYLIAIAEVRKDIIAFVSPDIADTVNNSSALEDVLTFANALTSSSYAVIDSTALKVYDKYNDQYTWIPAAGHVAGLCANTDDVADPWFSPAGFTRGQILGITKIAFNPKQAERDSLYKARVNPIVSFPGQGTVLYGDKTALAKPSAFDRINVRRLFITLEKAISTAAKYQLFELNDEFTRAMFRNMVEPFLREVKGRRGITDFAVICDNTNNTGNIIDTNQFVADIYIKPARSINFITLNFIATRTGVQFSEIVG